MKSLITGAWLSGTRITAVGSTSLLEPVFRPTPSLALPREFLVEIFFYITVTIIQIGCKCIYCFL